MTMDDTAANTNTTKRTYNVAIVGGGITGASAAYTLLKNVHEDLHDESNDQKIHMNVHLFDQGRRGVGGRSSHRHVNHQAQNNDNDTSEMRWDHGCQFFRADTTKFQKHVQEWISKGIVKEWNGRFLSSKHVTHDFFGLPSNPPFYVGGGVNGMQSVSKGILDLILEREAATCSTCTTICRSASLEVFEGTRVSQLERDDETNKWKLYGTSGVAAFHDTPEETVQQMKEQSNDTSKSPLGSTDEPMPELSSPTPPMYDAIILTDVSSSFGSWHRASAGIPSQFAQQVRDRVGARVPLFTAMVALDRPSDIPFDAATFHNDTVWFAAKTNSKPGMSIDTKTNMKECWTIVSTPEYAMEKIEETPMQDPKTGSFIPQSEDYLTTVPGPDLWKAFCEELTSSHGVLGERSEEMTMNNIPNVAYMNAQRWGSAMPCHRHLGGKGSLTRKVISNVSYDSGRGQSLAPTKLECGRDDEIASMSSSSYLVDDDLMLYQAGDMMSNLTPGFESAALSGIDAAENLLRKLHT